MHAQAGMRETDPHGDGKPVEKADLPTSEPVLWSKHAPNGYWLKSEARPQGHRAVTDVPGPTKSVTTVHIPAHTVMFRRVWWRHRAVDGAIGATHGACIIHSMRVLTSKPHATEAIIHSTRILTRRGIRVGGARSRSAMPPASNRE